MDKDMVFDHSKLLGRMKEYGFTQDRMAAALGLSVSTLNYKLNGKAVFTQKEIRKICDILEIQSYEVGLYFFTLKVQKN